MIRKLMQILLLTAYCLLPTAVFAAISTVDSSGGAYSSVKLQSNSKPAIAHFDHKTGELRYSYWTANGTVNQWIRGVVEEKGVTGYVSLYLDGTNKPYISYYHNISKNNSTGTEISGKYGNHMVGALKYAYCPTTTCLTPEDWTKVTVAQIDSSTTTNGYTGGWTSLAFDSSGNPRIAYYDFSHKDNPSNPDEKKGALKLAYRVSSGAISISFAASTKKITRSSGSFITDGFVAGNKITTDATLNPGPFTIVSITATEIVVTEAVVDEVSVTKTVTSWMISKIDSDGGRSASMVIYGTKVMLSYDADEVQKIKYAEASSPSSSWNKVEIATMAYTGSANLWRDTSIAINSSGKPMIVYQYQLETGYGNRYLTGNNRRGTEFNPYYYTDPVYDQPGIKTRRDLYYAYCDTDPCTNSANWKPTGTPIGRNLANGNTYFYGYTSSIKVRSDGLPRIAYHYWGHTAANQYTASPAQDIYEIICNNSDCSSFSNNLRDSTNNTGLYSSMILDSSNNPLISYYDYDSNQLKLYHPATSYTDNPASVITASVRVSDNQTTAQSGLQSGDTFTILFSGATKSCIIDKDNIDTILKLSNGHSWVKCSGSTEKNNVDVQWSNTYNTISNTFDTLTIKVYSDPNNNNCMPTVEVGDRISINGTCITDRYDNPIILQTEIKGNTGVKVPPSGAVAYYKMDEGAKMTAYDSAGGHHASLNNGVTWTTGAAGYGVSLDGSNDYLSVPVTPNELDNAPKITIEAWLKPNSLFGTNYTVLNKENSYGIASNGQCAIGTPGSTWASTQTSPATPPWYGTGSMSRWQRDSSGYKDIWRQVVCTYDGTTQKVYIDGILDGSRSGSGNVNPSNYPFIMGRREITTWPTSRGDEVGSDTGMDCGWGGGSGTYYYGGCTGENYWGQYYYNGKMDEVVLYNTALKEEEIITRFKELPAQLERADASDSPTVSDVTIMNGYGFQSGDTIAIRFTNETNAPTIDASNINRVLAFNNIITNSSFESGSGVDASNWTESTAADRVSTQSRSGSYSMAIINPSAAQETYSDCIAVTANTSYTLTAWAYNAYTTGNTRLDVQEFMGASCATSLRKDVNGVSTNPNSGFTQLTNTFTTTTLTASIRIRMIVDGARSGTAYWDDVSLASSKTWLDGSGNIGSAVWSGTRPGFNKDTLTITLSDTGGAPTVATGQKITLDGGTIKDKSGTYSVTGSTTIRGSYDLKGAVAYWKFDESSGNPSDSVGQYNTGTLKYSTTASTYSPGKYNNAINFDGGTNSQYVEVSNYPDLNLSSNVTVEAWVKFDTSNTTAWPFVFSKRDDTNLAGYSMGIDNSTDKISFGFYDSTGTPRGSGWSTNPLSNGVWTHVVGTFDGSNIKLYINGVLDKTVPFIGTIKTSPQTAYIGQYGGNYFKGSIDELVIYNRAITAHEVRTRYGEVVFKSAVAKAVVSSPGIQATDKVVITFDFSTAGTSITSSNINTALALSNGHSWKDGAGNIGSAVWSQTTYPKDTLTITLSTGTSAPTVAVGDTITLGTTIKDRMNRSLTGSIVIGGSFGDNLPANRIAYYNFDEQGGTTAYDSAPDLTGKIGNNHGTLGNSFWKTERIFKGLYFDGSRYVQVPDSDDFNLSSYTIDAWVKVPDNLTTGVRRIISQESTDGLTYWKLQLNNNKLELCDSRLSTVCKSTTATINDGEWHHVVAVRNDTADEVILYIDGDATTTTFTGITETGSHTIASTIQIGRKSDSTEYFYGMIDDLAVYNRALDITEIQSRYRAPLKSAFTSDTSFTSGKQAGDKVVIRFHGKTNGYAIDASNINTVLQLSSGSWLDGAGQIGSAVWSSYKFTNDTLTITLSAGTSAPTIASGVTITVNGTYIKDTFNNAISDSMKLISRDFDFNLPEGAVAYWKLDEGSGITANDSFGQNNIASITASWNATGKFGKSLNFSAANQYASISNSYTLNPERISIEGWVYGGPIWWSGDSYFFYSSSSAQFYGTNFSRAVNFKVYVNGAWQTPVSYTPSSISGWHHYAGTYDGTNLKIYVDGVLQATSATTTGVINQFDTGSFYLGAATNGSGYYIDDVAVYNRALTADEVLGRYGDYTVTAIARDTSGGGVGIQTGDTVTFKFSGPTNGAAISATNIENTLPPLPLHYWRDCNNAIESADWTSSPGGYSNDTLTVTLKDPCNVPPPMRPDVTPGDTITIGSPIGSKYRAFTKSVKIGGLFGDNLPALGNKVAYWNFDEQGGGTAFDSIGDNYGTLNNSFWKTEGQFKGLYFDGSRYVEILDVAGRTDFNLSSYTIDAWVKVPKDLKTTYGTRRIISQDDGTNYWKLQLTTNNEIELCDSRLTLSKCRNTTATIHDGEWHHIVAIHDDALDKFLIYIDGIARLTATDTTGGGTAHDIINSNIQIGRKSDGTEYFYGMIDELAIYNRALDITEIQSRYRAPLKSAFTSDSYFTAGIQDGKDKVIIRFHGKTNGYIPTGGWSGSNIGTYLQLSSGSWGTIQSAAWSTYNGITNNTLTITLGSGATIASGATITVIGTPPNTITDVHGNAISNTITLSKDFDFNLPEGAISYWKLDEGSGLTVNDSFGQNIATYSSGVWQTTGCMFSNCLNFNTTNRYAQVNNSYLLNPERITVEAWVYTPTGTTIWSGDSYFFNGSSSAQLYGGNYTIFLTSYPAIYFRVYVDSAWRTLTYTLSSSTISGWHHYVGTYDGVSVKLYRDGVLVGTAAYTGVINQFDTGSFYLGNTTNGSGYSIDDVTVYNRALTLEEVLGRYGQYTTFTAFAKDRQTPAQSGIQAGDTVEIRFPGPTNGTFIDASNIDNFLYLSNSHTWKNTTTGIVSAEWSKRGYENDTLTITLRGVGGDGYPDVKPLDTISMGGAGEIGAKYRAVAAWSAKISGTFGEALPGTPVAFWKMDENLGTIAFDSVGTNDGTLTNSPTWTNPAMFNSGLNFNSSTAYMSVPSIDLSGDWSIESWFYYPLPTITTITNVDTFDFFESWTEYSGTGSVGSGWYNFAITSIILPPYFNRDITDFDESYNYLEFTYQGYGANGPSSLKVYYTDGTDCTTIGSETCAQSFTLIKDSSQHTLYVPITDAEWVDNDGIIGNLRFALIGATVTGTFKVDSIKFEKVSYNSLTGDRRVVVQRSDMHLGTHNGTNFVDLDTPYVMSGLTSGWHHIAAVGDSTTTTTKFYIDGVLAGTANYKSTAALTTVGNATGGSGQFGLIDEVAVYSSALTVDDVAARYLVFLKEIYAKDTSKGGAGIQNGDQVIIRFDGRTGATFIDANNINTALQLSAGSWGTAITSANWSTVDKTNDTLTITLQTSATLAARGTITLGNVIKDAYGKDITGSMQIGGDFGTNLPDGAVAYYKFDDGTSGSTPTTASDSFNDYNGTLTNTPTWTTTGRFNNALQFTGGTGTDADYVVVSNATALNPGKLTVEAWAKSETTNWNATDVLVTKSSAYKLSTTSGSKNMSFSINGGGTWRTVTFTADGSFDITKWHHYVGTYDGTTLKIYVDGVEKTPSTAYTGSINTTATGNLYIGNDGGTAYLNGSVDEVVLYNKALDAPEVRTRYGAGFMSAIADDNSNKGPNIQANDRVVIKFTGQTNGPAINAGNINTILPLSNITLFSYDFSGTTIDTTKLTYGGTGSCTSCISQNNELTIRNDANAWDTYVYTNSTFARSSAKAFQAKFKADTGTLATIGWHDGGTGASTADLVYAISFENGTLRIYEDGNLRASPVTYTYSTWYDVRIELKATGAKYYYKLSTSSTWILLYDSSYSSEATLRPGVAHNTIAYSYTDDWVVESVTAASWLDGSNAIGSAVWSNTGGYSNDTLTVTLSGPATYTAATPAKPTVVVGDTITLNGGITDSSSRPIKDTVKISGTFGIASAVTSSGAAASDASGKGPNIQANDTVVITFSGATNTPSITAGNINTMLPLLSSHSWLDGAGAIVSAVWTTNATLTITLSGPATYIATSPTKPTVEVGEAIKIDGTITDSTGKAIISTVPISGSFGSASGVTPSSAAASDASGKGPNIQSGDKVVITFSGATNTPPIDATNINTILPVTGKTWRDGNNAIVSAVWTTNATLTITLSGPATYIAATPTKPTVVVGDTITIGGTITDSTGKAIISTVQISGSFGIASTVSSSGAAASDASGKGPNIQANDRVVITFINGATSAPAIDATNINTILPVAGSTTTTVDTFDTTESWTEVNGTGSVVSGWYNFAITNTADPYFYRNITDFDESYDYLEFTYQGYGSSGPSSLTVYYMDGVDCTSYSGTCSQSFPLIQDSLQHTLLVRITDAEWVDNDNIITNIRFDLDGAVATGTFKVDAIKFRLGKTWKDGNGAIVSANWNSPTNTTLTITLSGPATYIATTPTKPTVVVGDTIVIDGTITDSSNKAIISTVPISDSFGIASGVTLSGAAASDASGEGPNIQANDTVVITFNGATNTPSIDATNINTILPVTGKTWRDGSNAIVSAVWTTNATLTITLSGPATYLDTTPTKPTVVVGDTITINGTITDSTGKAIISTVTISGTFGVSSTVTSSSAVASDTSNWGPNIQSGDRVVITFSGATSAPTINAGNINTILPLLSSHSWLDGDGVTGAIVSAVWNSPTNTTLTITLSGPDTQPETTPTRPTVVVGEAVKIDGTITDSTGKLIINSNKTLTGSFGTASGTVISSAIASGDDGKYGIQTGDKVIIKFNGQTNGPTIDASNINTVLAVSGKTWLDGNNAIVTANWNSPTNDTLTVTLSNGGTPPSNRIDAGNTITLGGNVIKDKYLIAISSSIAISGDFAVPSSAKALWKFESNGNDSLGSYSGTVTGTYPTGRFSNGVLFDASNEYNNITQYTLTSNWTIEGWFKWPITAPVSGQQKNVLVSSNSTSNENQIIIDYVTKGIGTSYSNSYYMVPNYDLKNLANGWHHVAAVGTGGSGTAGTTTFYIDGNSVGTGPAGYKSASHIKYIGNSYDGSRPMSNTIDNIVIYNTALSAATIKNRYGALPRSAYAYGTAGDTAGIQTGDQVVIRFDQSTEGNSITSLNIGSALTLSSSHTWGTIQSAVWSQTAYPNDTLTITLSTTGSPTIAVNDTITLSNNVIKDHAGRPLSDTISDIDTVTLKGSFNFKLPVGAIAYWKFDTGSGTAFSDSFGSNNGTLTGGVAWDNAMYGTKGVTIDANTKAAALTTPLNMPAEWTIIGWVKTPIYGTMDNALIHSSDGHEHAICIHTGTGNAEVGNVSPASDPGGNLERGTGYFLNRSLKNGWHQIAAVGTGGNGQGGTTRYYVDGQDIGEAVYSGDGSKYKAFTPIGALGNNTGAGAHAIGTTMDEISVYDRPLSAAEISQFYGARLKYARANNANISGGKFGINAGDQVVIKFDGKTSVTTPITVGNIDTVLKLSNGHTWLDGNGQIGGVAWTTSTYENDTLTITLNGAATSPPTITTRDTITLDGVTIKDLNRAITGSIDISGDFDSAAAYYDLDEGSAVTAADSINDNNGTLGGQSSTLPTWVSGYSGSALDFDDTNTQYVTIPDSENFNLTSYTIEAWIKLPTTLPSGNYMRIVSQESNTNPTNYWSLAINPSGQLVHCDSLSSLTAMTTYNMGGLPNGQYPKCETVTTKTLNDDKWHFVAVVRDTTAEINHFRFYIDHVLEKTTALNTAGTGTHSIDPVSGVGGTVEIGRKNGFTGNPTSSEYFRGVIDNVAIYNYALTDAEVNIHHFLYPLEAYASDTSGLGANIQAGDSVTILFNGETGATAINDVTTLNNALKLPTGKTWGIFGSAVWSTTYYTNDTLKITFGSGASMTIGNTITLGNVINDVHNNLITGSIAITGSFDINSLIGTIAYWRFNEGVNSTINDSVGSYSGSLYTTPVNEWVTTSGSCKTGFGSCLDFTGTTNYVTLPTAVPLSSSEWTIEAWFYAPLASTGDNKNVLITGPNPTINTQHILVDSARYLGTSPHMYGNDFRSSGYNGIGSLAAGWHHLVTVGKNSKTYFYIDGSAVGTFSNYQPSASISKLGNGYNASVEFKRPFGKIDDVVIYKRALSAAEILNRWQR